MQVFYILFPKVTLNYINSRFHWPVHVEKLIARKDSQHSLTTT
jgi:hypothetical protein